MVTLPIRSRMTSSVFSIVIFGAFFARMVIASQVSPASFPNESFKNNLQSVDDELDKFRDILRSNQNSTFFFTNSTNNTLSDIDNCIDLTRQSIEELKADHSPDTNYIFKIDNLQANAMNLQTSLIKLKQRRSTSSHIIDIGNAVFEKAQNLVKLLNRLNYELDDLREKIEAEKAVIRLRDEQRGIIEKLQNQIKMQQEEMGRFKEELRELLEKKAQEEKQQLLQQVGKIVADKIENIKHEIEDVQTKCVQKEWNITHTLHASLENHKKELQDEINRNKEQLVGEQKLIEQREKNNTNNVQVLLDNLKGQAQNFKHELDDMQKKITHNKKDEKFVADTIENIKHEIEDVQTKCVQKEWNITHTLHASLENHKKELQDEINRNKEQLVGEQKLIEQREKNNTNNVQVLLDNLKGQAQNFKHQLDDMQKKIIHNENDGKIVADKIENIKHEIENVQTKYVQKEWTHTLQAQLISSAFLNDNLWPIAKQVSADVVLIDCKEHHDHDCIFEIYRQVIERVWNKLTIDDLLQKAKTHLLYIDDTMAVHKAIISKLMQTNTLTASKAKKIARYMKEEIEMSNYKNVPADWRSEYEVLYNWLCEDT